MSQPGSYADLARIRAEKAAREREAATPPDLAPVESEPASPRPAALPSPRRVPESSGVESAVVESAPLVSTPLETRPMPERPRDAVRENFTKIPNGILGGDLAALSTGAQVLYFHLLQLTLGHNRDTCKVGRARLEQRTGMSESALVRASRQLVAFGLVEILGVDATGPKQRERGTEFRVYLPRATRLESSTADPTPVKSRPVESSPMKETPKESSERAPVAAAPADRYSIRKAAAQIHEAEPDISHGEIVAAVRRAFAVQGQAVGAGEIEAALEGLAL